MSDISTAHSSDSKSTVATTRSDVDWTVVGSNPASPAQSATSPSPPIHSRPSSPSEELATVTPSSPAQSLAESEEANPQSLDLISPITTPLPASPIEGSGGLDKELSTPVDSEWARSKLAISEGEDDGKSSIGTSDVEQEGDGKLEEDVKNEEEKGKDEEDTQVEEAPVPSLIFTKPTLSGNEVGTMVENSELPYIQSKKEAETSDESDKTDVPPLVNRINTRLAPTFLDDTQDHLFESPTTTNNAAPNSAISPKTSSFFFDTSRIRSPPRQGGATIVELPSDADTLGAESEGPRKLHSMDPNDTQTSDEDEQDDQEKPSSHSTGNKTIPLISPVHSSDQPNESKRPVVTASRSPRPPHLSRKPSPYGVSTFSRDHSPAPRPRLEHRSRSSDNRRRIEIEQVPTPRPESFFRSRTFVSSSAPRYRKSRPTPVENKQKAEGVEVVKPKPMTSLVEEIKEVLAGDSTAYYTLKGVLAEYEERKRSSVGRPEESKEKARVKEIDPDVEFVKAEKDKFLRRQPVKTKPSAPVKSFSYTQTDSEYSESEAETYKLPQYHRRSSSFLRQLVLPSLTGQSHSDAVPHDHKRHVVEDEPIEIRRPHQGSRAFPGQTAVPPQSPVYPSRLSPRPSHVPSSTTRAPPPSTGAKSSAIHRSVKLAKPSSVSALEASSRLALEKQLSAVKGLAPSPAPRTTSSTSALLHRPDLSPQKRSLSAKSIISPSRPLVHSPSTSKAQVESGNGGRFILFDYSPQVEQLVANGAKSGGKEKKSEGGRKRRLNEKEDGEGRKKVAMKSKGVGGKGKMVEKGKGKEKERENSISFDFDDFF